MSRSTNNLTRMLGNQQTRPDYSAHLPWDANYLVHDPWSPLEERLLLSLAGPREPLTAIAGPWTRQASPYQEQSKLTQDEQKVALQKLKKEIYNPMPKIISRRLSLFYQDNDRYHVSEKRKEHEDLKRCAICLEDFEPREQVLLTPCNHMFHEDCIVPWVKNHGQCPVCRFAICDRMKQSTAPSNNNMPVIYF
ncbi:E3 ubiquitin-protein ligase RING1-like [Vitis vinifera]|uniref:RING-type E3 ubiquitin transferase n=1 Tax=Vitis vinifera TaxID=29760 RepID=A0A438HMZ3_VITVI|nr:E3 ubiquitin-protein ligase RING1-like [Vitis vinifera]